MPLIKQNLRIQSIQEVTKQTFHISPIMHSMCFAQHVLTILQLIANKYLILQGFCAWSKFKKKEKEKKKTASFKCHSWI